MTEVKIVFLDGREKIIPSGVTRAGNVFITEFPSEYENHALLGLVRFQVTATGIKDRSDISGEVNFKYLQMMYHVRNIDAFNSYLAENWNR